MTAAGARLLCMTAPRGCVALVVALFIGFFASSATGGTPPPGATARCKDGTYSYSQHHSGTCSHHGGVAVWLTSSTSTSTTKSTAPATGTHTHSHKGRMVLCL